MNLPEHVRDDPSVTRYVFDWCPWREYDGLAYALRQVAAFIEERVTGENDVIVDLTMDDPETVSLYVSWGEER